MRKTSNISFCVLVVNMWFSFAKFVAKLKRNMENQRPLILISNDDGIIAKGISELIKFLRPLGEIVVMAPMRRVRVMRVRLP